MFEEQSLDPIIGSISVTNANDTLVASGVVLSISVKFRYSSTIPLSLSAESLVPLSVAVDSTIVTSVSVESLIN